MDLVRRLLAAGACLAVLGGLAGCGGDPEPQFEAEPSETPSVAETPRGSESAEPAPWEEKSPDGAVAFAKHWTATFSEAFVSGDTSEFRRLGDAECRTCNDLASLVEDVYGAGGAISGNAWRLEDLSSTPLSPGEKRATVSGVMRIPAQVFERTGEPPQRSNPIQSRFTFQLKFTGRGWLATQVTREA